MSDTDYTPIFSKRPSDVLKWWEFFAKHNDGVYLYKSFDLGKTWERELTPYSEIPVVQLKWKEYSS